MRVKFAVTAATLLLGSAASADPVATTETYFAFDSAQLEPGAARKLATAAAQLQRSPDAKLLVGGFADPRGASDYNVALSIRRAEAVRDALAELGVSPDRMVFAFYGEDGPPRASYALDRRVSIQLTRAPLHAIIDRALPEATAVVWTRPVTAAELTGRPIPVATR
jgi:outer membrane protein OmpA-like peptidoglycan-associated protein